MGRFPWYLLGKPSVTSITVFFTIKLKEKSHNLLDWEKYRKKTRTKVVITVKCIVF